MDGFRKSMALRKSRSKKFLEEATSLFTLLFSLAMNFLLNGPLKTCFLLFDADKEGLGIPNHPKEEDPKKYRRVRHKGAEALQLPELDEDRQYTLTDLHSSCLKVVDYLWKALEAPLELTILQVPAMYWPASRPDADMYRYMTGDMLRSLGGLKWRVCHRFYNPPHCLLSMLEPSCSHETRRNMTQKFVQMTLCCLSPAWGEPVRDDIVAAASCESEDAEGADVQVLMKHVQCFSDQSRSVSIREEHQHALQRKFAAGFNSKPRAFWQQASQTVLANSSRNFFNRQHGLVRKDLKRHWVGLKDIARTKKVVHKRPKQHGNAMFFYVGSQISLGSTKTHAELRAEWKCMSALQKQPWIWRQQTAVAKKREAQKLVDSRRQEERESLQIDTPWNLGDKAYPLRPELLQQYLLPFRRQESGLDALERAGRDHPSVESYLRKLESGQVRYHSVDAAVAASKAELGWAIAADNTVGAETWSQAEACPGARLTCFEKHPGTPRGRKLVFFVRMVLGWACRILSRSMAYLLGVAASSLRFQNCGNLLLRKLTPKLTPIVAILLVLQARSGHCASSSSPWPSQVARLPQRCLLDTSQRMHNCQRLWFSPDFRDAT